jgi:hypothetical protein
MFAQIDADDRIALEQAGLYIAVQCFRWPFEQAQGKVVILPRLENPSAPDLSLFMLFLAPAAAGSCKLVAFYLPIRIKHFEFA